MDGCTLQDAFPSGPVGSPGCLDRGSAEESRRQEKRRARRCRGPAANQLNGGWNMVGPVDTDPDRPATKPMASVPALNPNTGLTVHQPVSEQQNWESFVGSMDNLPEIRKDVAGQTELQKNDAPAFFGVNPTDDNLAAQNGRRGAFTETFTGAAPFVNVIGTDETQKLEPDFTKAFGSKGAQKAAGGADVMGPSPTSQEMNQLTPTGMMPNSILPVPNVDLFWKKNEAVAGGQSSFFGKLKYPGGEPAGTEGETDGASTSDFPASRREVLTKLDKIFARLDDMDAAKSENAQTEILLFIATGIGVIFLMDIGCRAVAGRR